MSKSKSGFTEARFKNEEAARKHLEAIRWPNGAVCPHCGGIERNSPLNGESHRPGLYHCGDCRKQFTVTVGTVFERSKIPLHKWVLATHLICASKKGMSSKQIERMLGVTYKTAWFMSHRIREAMKPTDTGFLGSGGGTVEADETFVGRKRGVSIHQGVSHKHAVFSLVERKGQARSFHVLGTMGDTLRPIFEKHLAKEAHLMTDEGGQYRYIGPDYASHQTVTHSKKEYVRGNVHTNTIEGFFSIFKRGVMGTFHHISEQHLQRYLHEFDFRYSYREKLGFTDAERTDAALKGISHKRLTYRRANEAA